MGHKDEDMGPLFASHLAPGEELVNWAFGVKQPSIWLIILCGGLLTAMFTKYYMVGLTSTGRFIVLGLAGMTGKKISGVQSYQVGQVGEVKTSDGMLFTHLKFAGPPPFVAKFHRLGMKNNKQHAVAMAQALSGKQLGA